MKIALITIATGKAYHEYAREMMASASKFMPRHDQLTFTDNSSQLSTESKLPSERNFVYTEPKGYPRETLMRYHTILKRADSLSKYDQIFYVDADMLFVDYVGEIFSDGVVATLHPGYVGKRGPVETRQQSAAFCDNDTSYYCGGFQGGKAARYLDIAENLAYSIDRDEENGVMAMWHDESHWNRCLAKYPPTKILSPSYCYPEDYKGQWGWPENQYKPILVALDKRKRGNHPRFQ